MAHRLRRNETLSCGLARVLAQQLDRAIFRLSDEAPDRHEGIHDARVALKKARALLRLVRVESSNAVRAGARQLRDISRGLSGLRDATSMIEGLGRLQGYLPETDLALYDAARQALVAYRGRVVNASDPEASAAHARAELRVARERFAGEPLNGVSKAGVDARLVASRQRASAGLSHLRMDSVAEQFHEFRKQVKTYLYQSRSLAVVSELAGGEDLDALQELALKLGEHQDLTLLSRFVQEGHLPALAADKAARLESVIEARQTELRGEILTSGHGLFSRSGLPAAILPV